MSENVQTLIGKKVGQTTYFEESGKATHVTVLEVGPCVVIQKKTQEKEGYNALQLGFCGKKGKTHDEGSTGALQKIWSDAKAYFKRSWR